MDMDDVKRLSETQSDEGFASEFSKMAESRRRETVEAVSDKQWLNLIVNNLGVIRSELGLIKWLLLAILLAQLWTVVA